MVEENDVRKKNNGIKQQKNGNRKKKNKKERKQENKKEIKMKERGKKKVNLFQFTCIGIQNHAQLMDWTHSIHALSSGRALRARHAQLEHRVIGPWVGVGGRRLCAARARHRIRAVPIILEA